MKDTNVTDVVFRMFDGDVIALFPGLAGTNDPYTCESFMHVGQHGSADPTGVVRESRPATPEEYAPLKRELESAPYNYNLRVVQRIGPHYLAQRRAMVRG